MEILAHRGFWDAAHPRNSLASLSQALDAGFGFESDIRDYVGELVISHNIADAASPQAAEVFRLLAAHGDRYPFAINIKADGLKEPLAALLREHHIENYFLFDMSVPQMVEFREMGLRFFTRQSEYEMSPVLYDAAAGVWIDGFCGTEWITEELLRSHLAAGKAVCIVSPDLHQRAEYRTFWARLRAMALPEGRVLLCTDHPAEARAFFEEASV